MVAHVDRVEAVARGAEAGRALRHARRLDRVAALCLPMVFAALVRVYLLVIGHVVVRVALHDALHDGHHSALRRLAQAQDLLQELVLVGRLDHAQQHQLAAEVQVLLLLLHATQL